MPDSASQDPSRNGRRRPRVTSARVRWIDRAATITISGGGLGVIVAVLGILVYLVWVVTPLFSGARLQEIAAYALLTPDASAGLLVAEVDEYCQVGVALLSSGEAIIFDARTGHELGRREIFSPGKSLTSWDGSMDDGRFAFGFDDGGVQVAAVRFSSGFVAEPAPAAPSGAEPQGGTERRQVDGAILERTAGGWRRSSVEISAEMTLPAAEGGAVTLTAVRRYGDLLRVALYRGGGALGVVEIATRTNMLTGEPAREITSTPIPLDPGAGGQGKPAFLLMTARGDQLFLAWPDGTTLRFNPDSQLAAAKPERFDMTSGPEGLAALVMGAGDQSLLAGDTAGQTRAWFRVERSGAAPDGYTMVEAHLLGRHAAPVTVLATSLRDKTIASGSSDGGIFLQHTTTEQVLRRASFAPAAPIQALQITPKRDGLFAVAANGRAALWELDAPHPEVTPGSLFGRVWYEGYPEPSWTWQSSSGTDDFEPKLSLMPLIFGTLKATIYSMLFAVPIALCAALYTSEFLDRRYRALVKSTVEMMASLPSVVLGFIAALVLAPLVESWVIAVLAVFAIAPLTALTAGYLWQLAPAGLSSRVGPRGQFGLLIALVGLAVVAATRLAAPIERILFAGDFKAWLDGRAGSATPGTAALIWPVILIGLLILDWRVIAESLARRGGASSRSSAALRDFLRYAGMVAASVPLAWLAGAAATAAGLDPRGALAGTYVQLNALVVGFVMGFAVIPIIYTIAEDSLSAVPETLRSASLGCGATRWQTATRVVLPVALSGIFSALMIGLGRAVGETMIVLMAAGNTPLMDLNIFNGLRTLSANIAVELPEAAKEGTLYRMLFLSALLLFLITFIVNTAAEMVRQRFRRRAYQL